jgi:hypothetical protein
MRVPSVGCRIQTSGKWRAESRVVKEDSQKGELKRSRSFEDVVDLL